MAITGPVTCSMALTVASRGRPGVHDALDVLDDDDGVVDHDADGSTSPNKVSVLIEKPRASIPAKVPMMATARQERISVARRDWRNTNDHERAAQPGALTTR